LLAQMQVDLRRQALALYTPDWLHGHDHRFRLLLDRVSPSAVILLAVPDSP